MNAQVHSRFALSLADLIKADAACCDGRKPNAAINAHDAIMAYRCNTLAEVRAKLHWMTAEGTGLTGEEDGFRLLIEDIDRLIATAV